MIAFNSVMMEILVILKPINSYGEQINGLVCIYDMDLRHERINTSHFSDNKQDRSKKMILIIFGQGLGNPNTLFHTLFSQTLILIWLTWPSYLKIYEDYKIYVYLEPPKRWLYDIDTHCVYSKHQPYPNWKPKVANMALSGFKTIFTMKQATLLPKKVSGWCSSTPGRGVISWKTTEFISGISDFCSLTADCGLIHQKNPVPL